MSDRSIDHLPSMRVVVTIPINTIKIEPGRRWLRDDDVSRLADSMLEIGMKTPITVRRVALGYRLVAGAHRLAAAQKLGWREIECLVMAFESDEKARMWELAENLHRAELSAVERAEHIAEWIRLTEKIDNAKLQSFQVETIESKRPDGRGHRSESGVNKAARDLGISKGDAHRAVKIASLTPEAKEAAVEVGLDDNQTALLRAAKAKPDDQTTAIRIIAREREETPVRAANKDLLLNLRGAIGSIVSVERRLIAEECAIPEIMDALAFTKTIIEKHLPGRI
jgi:ParB family transcriptional regulator, chromosome partitioning protein